MAVSPMVSSKESPDGDVTRSLADIARKASASIQQRICSDKTTFRPANEEESFNRTAPASATILGSHIISNFV